MEESTITPEDTEQSDSVIDVLAMVSAVWVKRKLISIIILASAIISLGISFILQESFLSTAVLLPETDKKKLSSLGGISDLAALAGVNVGNEGSLIKLYPTIAKSEAVLKNVIRHKYQTKEFPKPVDLIEYWELEEKKPERAFEIAVKSLRDELDISMDNKTSVITLAISMPEPQLSADILNVVTKELDNFIRTKQATSAGEQRKFVEARLVEVKEDLTKAENILKDFREKNRQVFSPQLLLEQERFIRDVQINATVYTELRKQLELVKIEEVKNIPVINVMDPARPAARKDKPKRLMIVISVMFISGFCSVGYVLVQPWLKGIIISVMAAVRASGKS